MTKVLRTTLPIMAQTFKNPQKSNLDLWTSLEPQLRAVKAGGMNSSQNTHWNHIRYGSDSEENIRCAKLPCFLEILVVEVPRDYSAWFYSAPGIKRCYNPSGSGLHTFQRRQMAKKSLSVQPGTSSSIYNHLERQHGNQHPPQTAAPLWCPHSKQSTAQNHTYTKAHLKCSLGSSSDANSQLFQLTRLKTEIWQKGVMGCSL